MMSSKSALWTTIVTWLRKKFYGDTPLHSAIKNFEGDISLVKSLLERNNSCWNSQVNVRNFEGESPLHLAVQNRRCSEELIQLLLEYGADVEVTTAPNRNTPLHFWALTNGNTFNRYGIADILLQHGSDLDAANINGDTPLHLCLRGNDSENFKLYWFAKKTRNINLINFKGETPLHLAVRNPSWSKVRYIKMLLDHGADVNKKDAKDENAYQAYCRAHKDEHGKPNTVRMAEILLQSKEREHMDSSLHVACLLHRVESVRKLLKVVTDVNAVGDFSAPPLYWALDALQVDPEADKGSTLILMLDYGTDIDQVFESSNKFGTRYISLLDIGLVGYIDSEDQDCVRTIFLAHLAKLFALYQKQIERDFSVKPVLSALNSSLFNDIIINEENHRPYNSYLFQCSKELKAMSETEVAESGLSVLDLLLANAEEMTRYAKNQELVKTFQAKMAMFSMYRGMLDAKLARELERQKLLESAAVAMSNALRFADPSDEFFEITLSYCCNEDLVHVIEAMELNTVRLNRSSRM